MLAWRQVLEDAADGVVIHGDAGMCVCGWLVDYLSSEVFWLFVKRGQRGRTVMEQTDRQMDAAAALKHAAGAEMKQCSYIDR